MTLARMAVERGAAARLAPLLVDVARLPLSLGYRIPAEATREHFRGVVSAALDRPESARVLAVADIAREPAGALIIQKAEWESGIYGISMARIPLVLVRGEDAAAHDAARALIASARDVAREWQVRHLSALVPAAETGVAHAFERDGWKLVDSTLEFAWEVGKTRPSAGSPRLALRDARASDRTLRDLTKEVYTRSIRTRFLADPWLPAERTGELYARWFENAIDGTFADNVVIAELDGRPVGFNMVKIESDLSRIAGVGFAAHGIAAVDAVTRGLGAQPAMLHYSTEWFGKQGGRFTRGRVLIQNQAMQRACLKSGGFIAQAFHTFHAWLGEEPPPGGGSR